MSSNKSKNVFDTKSPSKLIKLIQDKDRMLNSSFNSLDRDLTINDKSFEECKQRNEGMRMDLNKSFNSNKHLSENINKTNEGG